MRAFVLSGGSIKGAFQAGALRYALGEGIIPDHIYGVSVGALNGAFITDRAGRAVNASKTIDWPQIGKDLAAFWENSVTRPEDLVDKRSGIGLAWAIIRSKFDGMVGTGPLRGLVKREIQPGNLIAAHPILKYSAGAVNLNTGDITYANSGFFNVQEYIIASTAIPIVMPLVALGGAFWYDGGMRDVAPLSQAIKNGADEILCITCQPEGLSAANVKPGNILSLFERVSDIITDEILRNDLKQAERINTLLRESPNPTGILSTYRDVPTTTIQPENTLDVSIERFTSADIRKMLENGYERARTILG